MSPAETWEEPSARFGSSTTRLLVYVLGYDDLLEQASAKFHLDHLPRAMTLGRAADDRPVGVRPPHALRVPDPWMSGDHATLERRGDAYVISDLGSRNGTYVNGSRVAEHRLADGDLIEVGHSLFCYRAVDLSLALLLDQPEENLRMGPTRTFCPEVALLLSDFRRIAQSKEPVLLLAETGAGKEIAASEIHRQSGRKGPFCPVDCGAIPEGLFESTFFGHRKGAFTHATESRLGEIPRADGGTLFLDEVANMSPSAQAKLLRVLEDGKVTALGAPEATLVDVRWVAATNRELMGDPAFRSDLLRRLAGYVGRIPPLRRRREDLGVLASHVLQEAGIRAASITSAAARRLFCDPFDGNVRQLRATLRSAAFLAGGQAIDERHLPELAPPLVDGETAPQVAEQGRQARKGPPSPEQLEAVLAATKGNVVRAAAALGTHPRQLYRWLEKANLSPDKYRG
ncbi:MAG: sigma 54-interacting transcriptional regulator [Deltaproteobacteria bacterium]|nr:sigma 54-interacting transcriptional regulator [Deltaproteobacteria bacterium]